MAIEREVGKESVFLPERLMTSCEDDVLLAFEVVEDFQETTPPHMRRLTAAVMAHDPIMVRQEAHAILGSSRTIGAEALAAVCARMETAGKSGDLSDAPMLLAEVGRQLHTLSSALTQYQSHPKYKPT